MVIITAICDENCPKMPKNRPKIAQKGSKITIFGPKSPILAYFNKNEVGVLFSSFDDFFANMLFFYDKDPTVNGKFHLKNFPGP